MLEELFSVLSCEHANRAGFSVLFYGLTIFVKKHVCRLLSSMSLTMMSPIFELFCKMWYA